jgi:hypothetical protein
MGTKTAFQPLEMIMFHKFPLFPSSLYVRGPATHALAYAYAHRSTP